ncbi:MAG: hypothetical protein LPJ87_11265 [Zoogloeaceae bacterium]|nr:hypothetical protein [Zoogloeaceae bacterium]
MRDDDFDEDSALREADALLRKADALLARGRGDNAAPVSRVDDDDLPLVTEIVPGGALPPKPEPEHEPGVRVAEQLIDLDTAIKREIEAWLSREMPEIVERELDLLHRRIRAEVVANMRVTLLPRLSDEIASRLPDAGQALKRR